MSGNEGEKGELVALQQAEQNFFIEVIGRSTVL